MKVSEPVMALVSQCRTDGNALFLTCGQLDRKMYEAVNKVLEAAGGKWNRKQRAHLYAGDAAEAMEQVLLTGEVTCAKQEFGFFETPPAIVDELLARADVQSGHLCLEPSAGRGAIARELARIVSTEKVGCVELQPQNASVLRGYGLNVEQTDFLTVSHELAPRYDRIVMNPPFAKRADIHHVQHALKFLAPRGRLVSVMSSAVTFREDRLAKEFRELIAERHGSIEPLPQNSFKESGTSVNTAIVTLEAA